MAVRRPCGKVVRSKQVKFGIVPSQGLINCMTGKGNIQFEGGSIGPTAGRGKIHN